MLDLAVFHQNLLGIDPEKTPPEFRITQSQKRLYTAGQRSSKHGFLFDSNQGLESWEHFLATFILAYGQTPTGVVAFAVRSGPTQKWVNEQIKKTARHIFGSRAKSKRKGIDELYANFQRLAMGSNILQLAEPERWVAYGFNEKDILPPWMRGRLLHSEPS